MNPNFFTLEALNVKRNPQRRTSKKTSKFAPKAAPEAVKSSGGVMDQSQFRSLNDPSVGNARETPVAGSALISMDVSQFPKWDTYVQTEAIKGNMEIALDQFANRMIGAHAASKAKRDKAQAYLRNYDIDVKSVNHVLLSGPTGTGKTYTMECMASYIQDKLGDVKMHTFKVDNSKMRHGVVGDTEKMVGGIFDYIGKLKGPVYVMMDEIDTISRRGFGTQQDTYTITGILKERMQAFTKSHPNVMIVMATNNPDDLDPALRESHRVNNVHIGRPDEETKKKLMANLVTKHFTFSGVTQEELDDIALTLRKSMAVGANFDALREAIKRTKTATLRAVEYKGTIPVIVSVGKGKSAQEVLLQPKEHTDNFPKSVEEARTYAIRVDPARGMPASDLGLIIKASKDHRIVEVTMPVIPKKVLHAAVASFEGGRRDFLKDMVGEKNS